MGIKGEKGVKANSLDSNLHKYIHWTVEGRGQSNRLGHFVLSFSLDHKDTVISTYY